MARWTGLRLISAVVTSTAYCPTGMARVRKGATPFRRYTGLQYVFPDLVSTNFGACEKSSWLPVASSANLETRSCSLPETSR